MRKRVKKLSFLIAVVFILQLLFILPVSASNLEDAALQTTFVTAEYYIRNRHYPRYVQVDDNDKPEYSTSGSILE